LWSFTDLSGQSIGPTFKLQAAFFIMDFLNLKYGNNLLSRNVGKQPQVKRCVTTRKNEYLDSI
jgi:hypothetical protein